MAVARDEISVSMLAWVGGRWWTRTKAMPGSTGRAWGICGKASSPPAAAPAPTTGKDRVSSRGPASSAAELAAEGVGARSAGAGSAGLRFLRAIAIVQRRGPGSCPGIVANQARKTRGQEEDQRWDMIALDAPTPRFLLLFVGRRSSRIEDFAPGRVAPPSIITWSTPLERRPAH